MNNKQLRELIIKPALESLGMYSKDAENLIAGTIAQESRFGHYVHQVNGVALGICQMEVATYQDIWDNYLKYKPNLSNGIYRQYPSPSANMLVYDLNYSVMMCRLHYRRVPEPLPSTLDGYAKYWKKYYNTILGKGTKLEFIDNYLRYAVED